LKVPRREKISYEECKRRVTLDFEEEMGITDVLDDDPDEDMLTACCGCPARIGTAH